MFLCITRYLRQFVNGYSILAAPSTDILCNKNLASRRARKRFILWDSDQEKKFHMLNFVFAFPTILPFPDMKNTFGLRTDACEIGAGALRLQPVGDDTHINPFASHGFSRTDSRRVPTKRDCMAERNLDLSRTTQHYSDRFEAVTYARSFTAEPSDS